MSDSDDTDLLLLIPPDFFNVRNNCKSPEFTAFRSAPTPDFHVQMDCVSGNDVYKDDYNYQCRTQYYNNTSTPKKGEGPCYKSSSSSSAATTVVAPRPLPPALQPDKVNNNSVLNEIDNYLQADNLISQPHYSSSSYRSNLEDSLIDCKNMSFKEFQSIDINDINALDNNNKRLFLTPKKAETHTGLPRKINYNLDAYNKDSNQLISLSEMWGCNGATSATNASHNSTLHEEKLRRQHLEKSIHSLQMQLLEYQQKIAVAVKVDQDKNDIITRLEEANCKLDRQAQELDKKNIQLQEQMYEETRDIRIKNHLLEQEIADAIELVKKFQNKNEILELKVENLSTASNEITSIHKAQLKDFEIRLSNSMQNEKLIKTENTDLKKEIARMKDDVQNVKLLKKEIDELKQQNSTLKQQKENFCSSLNQERHNKDSLEKKNKNLQEKIEELNNKEKNLAKELDIQRISLKKYYQSQLEEVVGEKLKEFQSQLNQMEENLRDESRQRERLLAERAIKQIELIIQKNDQEISLLTEKYNEEGSLYRIQLSNASKSIEELEYKLSTYRDKRADIAERLHNIMEMQWQKALEVLTNPAAVNDSANCDGKVEKFQKINGAKLDKDRADDVQRLQSKYNPENDIFETPVSSRSSNQRNHNANENNKDLLQNYIEMLLKKSPKDLEQLDLLMSARKPTNVENNQEFCNKNSSTKRPWK